MLDMIVRYLHEALVPFRLSSYPSAEHIPKAGHLIPPHAIAVESRVVLAGDKLVLTCHPANANINLAALSNELHAAVVEASSDDLPGILQGTQGPPPPLGHLFGMSLVVDEEVTRHASIVFQPFGESDYFEVPYDDFARQEQPRIASFARGGELPARWRRLDEAKPPPRRAERRRHAVEVAMTRLREPVGPHDHVIGRAQASAQLVEYLDYECPYSARAHYELAEVLRRVGPDVLYVARHFPLTQVHRHALLAAQAAEAAGSQGRFWPMHSMLFENQDALEPDDVLRYAEAIGLDLGRFLHEMRTRAHLPKIERDFRSGVRSGVHGTPTFFLDGVRADRGWDADSLTAAIMEGLRRGGAAALEATYIQR